MDNTAYDKVNELISMLSKTLANIDFEYEFELNRIRSTAKPDLRITILDRVRRRHIERREPYIGSVQQVLQNR